VELGPIPQRPSRVLFTAWTSAKEAHPDASAGPAFSGSGSSSGGSLSSAAASASPARGLPLEYLRTSDARDMARLHRLLEHYPPAILYYLCTLVRAWLVPSVGPPSARVHMCVFVVYGTRCLCVCVCVCSRVLQVLPSLLRHQSDKLTASGCDLGNGTLFGLQLGFSGTPSNLLPWGMGPCIFEPGSSAQVGAGSAARMGTPAERLPLSRPTSFCRWLRMHADQRGCPFPARCLFLRRLCGQVMRVLADSRVMGHTILRRWSLLGLLKRVAQSTQPRFHALIDIGALITGLPNVEVARTLLHFGLAGLDGVVFLDDSDRWGCGVPSCTSRVRAASRLSPICRAGVQVSTVRSGPVCGCACLPP
jgi:hypothetical protein